MWISSSSAYKSRMMLMGLIRVDGPEARWPKIERSRSGRLVGGAGGGRAV